MTTEYTIISEEILNVWNGQVIKRELRKSNGEIIIRHTEVKRDVAVVLGLTTENTVICIKQFRFGPMKLQIELPAGKIERGEEPLVAASREFLEETGYTGDFEYVGKSLSSPNASGYRYIYVCKNLVKIAPQNLTQWEEIEICEIEVVEFVKLAKLGQIFPVDSVCMGLIHLKLLK